MEKMQVGKSSISFMTKKAFEERRSSECFSIKPEVEEKLASFADQDILAFDVSVNSPAQVVDVNKADKVVDFISSKLQKEGHKQTDINKAFTIE